MVGTSAFRGEPGRRPGPSTPLVLTYRPGPGGRGVSRGDLCGDYAGTRIFGAVTRPVPSGDLVVRIGPAGSCGRYLGAFRDVEAAATALVVATLGSRVLHRVRLRVITTRDLRTGSGHARQLVRTGAPTAATGAAG